MDYSKQDQYEEGEEKFKPVIESQKVVGKSKDEKQDELIKQLQEGQGDIVRAIEYGQKAKAPKPNLDNSLLDLGVDEPIPDEPIPNVDDGMSNEYVAFLKEIRLPMTSEVVSTGFDVDYWIEKAISKMNYLEWYVNEQTDNSGEFKKNKYSSDVKITYDRNIKRMSYIKDYLERLEKIKTAPQHEGTGILSQRNRNAYKISQRGSYGNLIIDLPKLIGQLRLVAHKNGGKVFDKV